MSDPKDKLVLFKEILSLMIVTIGFMTALMSSGVVRNIKVEPLTLIIIIAVLLFIVQFLVRVVFGEEKYDEIKKRVLYTARDFSIILIVIIGFYFAGKYVANQSAPLSGPVPKPAVESQTADNDLSAAPLKNLKKEKPVSPVKPKDKQASKKNDERPSKTQLKAAPEEVKTVKKPVTVEKKITAEVKPEKTAEASLMIEAKNEKTSGAIISEVRPEKTMEVKTVTEAKIEKTAEAKIISEAKIEKTAEASLMTEVKPEKPVETSIISEVKPEKPVETLIISEVKSEKTAEASLKPEAVSVDTGHSAAEMVLATVENKIDKVPKKTETVVINVTAEDEPDNNELPLEAVLEPAAESPAVESPAADESAAKPAGEGSDEVLTYKMIKDEDVEDNARDDSTVVGGAKTSVEFERTSSDLREKVNNDKVIIKKEYELNKTPGGIKNAGDKILEGGRKIFDGGANLIEKAGQGIKKQVDKVIK